MASSRIVSLVLANILIPIAVLVFATGFFPYKPFLAGLATFDEVETEELGWTLLDKDARPKAIFDKVVFMVVDALRSDFVYGQDSGFVFTQSLIETGAAIPFTAHATSPTITMPRVKALTTGGVPSFLDVILNFAESDTTSTLATQDTWLAQVRANLRSGGSDEGKLVFYGDDTWLKLFPGFFAREDGTSSFFVSDFTEVDNNVTRHLDRELARGDWNGMIMHYLGLDHIGHKAGPTSPNMLPKQREMDEIVQRIYAHTLDWQLENTLIVLAGDHGMNSAGNHGGSAPGETSPALVFISPKFRTITCGASPSEVVQAGHTDGANLSQRDLIELQKDLAAQSCKWEIAYKSPVVPREGTEFEYYRQVEQSDVVPTLAALLGFPIPRNNLGVLIPEMLRFWPDAQKPRRLNPSTQLLFRNALQILTIIRAQYGDAAFDNTSRDSRSEPENDSKRVGEGSLDDVLPSLLKEFLTSAQDALSTTASSYDVPRLVSAVVTASIALTLALYSKEALWPPGLAGLAFTLVTALYGIMMFASSYVEEEQHFWAGSTGKYRSVLLWITLLLGLHRLSTRWTQTGQKHAGAPDVAYAFFPEHHILLWISVVLTYVYSGLCLSRRTFFNLCAPEIAAFAAASLVVPSIIFKLNFTEADAPELVQGLAQLIREGTAQWSLVSQAQTVFIALGFSLVVVVVLHVGHAKFDQDNIVTRITSLPKRLHGLLTLFLITQTRVQNIPLFLLFEGQYQLLKFLLASPESPATSTSSASASSPALTRPTGSMTALPVTLSILLFSHVSYFCAGGSNAISSIDLSNAYNGVSGYNVLAVGILLFCSNWAGPIWWSSAAVLLLSRVRDGPTLEAPKPVPAAEARRQWVLDERKRLGEVPGQTRVQGAVGKRTKRTADGGLWHDHIATLTVFVAASLVAVMGACTVLRTHLFIWTVFSPKYLYAMAWSMAWHLIVSCGFSGLLYWLS
ncbi:hypothetical protein MBLNU459_g5282t1 [Dothideomycetes sp. NU459]